MSYCRFSSDGFQCDVYVYQSAEGWITHVAARRRAERAPDYDWSTPEIFKETYAVHRAFLDDEINHPSLPIGLSEDGKTFCDPSPEACAVQLVRLRDLGYHVPQYAIEALREEV